MPLLVRLYGGKIYVSSFCRRALNAITKGFFMSKKYVVSESVCAGHPDKLADQISDAILDAALTEDPNARVAAETLLAYNHIVLAGEITTTAKLDFEAIARGVIKQEGYTNPDWGFTHDSPVLNILHQQSPEIAVGVDNDGAGDQGLMYGYACRDTPELMPLSIAVAHALTKEIDTVRQNTVNFLRPDGKAQIVLGYEDSAITVKHVTLAAPHDESVSLKKVSEALKQYVIYPVLDSYGLAIPKDIIINGTGVWHKPGPASDVGLTGRKIVVDTYGGVARVGGGAFSGKDPSKVDRSGAYAARYIAKNIVAAGLADKAEVCLAYYIGAKKPIIQQIDTYGTETVKTESIQAFAAQLIDCSVKGIIDTFKLRRPIYQQTARYGHFGNIEYPWERV